MSKIFILWDIDGTLLDTRGAGVEPLTQAISSALGRDVSFDRTKMAGKSDYEIIDFLTQITSNQLLQEEVVEKVLTSYTSGLSSNLLKNPAIPLGDIRNALQKLQNEAIYELGILSGNCEIGGEVKLRNVNLDIFFDKNNRFFADFIKKTRIEILRSALSQGQRALLIGDTPNDINTANAFGIPIVSVSTGSFDFNSLQALNPGRVLQQTWTYDELIEMIKEVMQ
jgi:phosphoglycolate phosphatase-like HAD superfamily hydrolase